MIQRKITALLGAAALAMSASASANVDQHVQMTFESGGVFSGTVTFLNDFSAYVGVSGTLTGGTNDYSSVISWVYDSSNWSTGTNNFSNFLMDGTPDDYGLFIQFAYNYTNAPSLLFTSGVSYDSFDNYINQTDALVSGSITAVPEPETYAMLIAGLGLVGMMARRRKA